MLRTQVVVSYPRQPRYYPLLDLRKKLGRLIAGGKFSSIANLLLTNPASCYAVFKALSREVMQEVRRLCSDKHSSILRETSKAALKSFSWHSISSEIKSNSPALYSILEACLQLHKPTHQLRGRAVLCTIIIVAMMCKERNPKMCLIQGIISLLLHAGHSGKQVRMYYKA